MTVAAMLMAMNIIMSSSVLSIPVPGGHMYLNDVIIVTAAVLLDPFLAVLVGGGGAFIGDLLFYPAPMFVSLVVHGLQAFVISLFVHRIMKQSPVKGSVIGTVIGWIITFTGYSLLMPLPSFRFRFCRRPLVPCWLCCFAGNAG